MHEAMLPLIKRSTALAYLLAWDVQAYMKWSGWLGSCWVLTVGRLEVDGETAGRWRVSRATWEWWRRGCRRPSSPVQGATTAAAAGFTLSSPWT